jgi:predicted amidohydrolase YtcJ
VQHRSGRLWILNSRALEQLGELAADTPLERVDGRITGRLYDGDAWLRSRIGTSRPDLSEVSRLYASRGVTGLTDTSQHNGPDEFRIFAMARQRGELLQDLLVMGDTRLDRVKDSAGVTRGAHKFHLHEHQLPDFEVLCAQIRRAHRAGRAAAFHCVTRTDLVFALSALRDAGSMPGDRIEHAAVAPPELMPEFVALGLAVVTQPGFIAERGDDYLRDVAAEDQPWLYRLRGFLDAGVALAGSSDAPYTDPNPWPAMQAAVARRTRDGRSIGADEALTPEQALALFTSPLRQPGAAARRVEVGAPADLCLLDAPWHHVRANLAKTRIRLTLKDGAVIWGGDAQQ